MTNIYRRFVSEQKNISVISQKFLALLKRDVTSTSLRQKLEDHPNYPSMLYICDAMKYFNIENIAIEIPIDKLKTFTLPFIAVTKKGDIKEGS